MKLKTGKTFLDTIFSAIAWRMLDFLNKKHKNENLPRLFCSPTDFLGKQIIANGLFEKESILLVKKIVEDLDLCNKQDSVFVDIGANIGNHTCFFACNFDKVISFEPSPLISKVLSANVILNNLDSQVTIIQKALSNEKKILDFFTTKQSDNLGGSTLLKDRTDNEVADKIEVDKGDSILPVYLNQSEKINLIKIDVEGHEVEVIEGILNILQTHCPVLIFETDNGINTTKCFNILKQSGYSNFYEIKKDAYENNSKLSRVLKRFMKGSKEIELAKILNVEDRYYETIICIPLHLYPKLSKLKYVPA